MTVSHAFTPEAKQRFNGCNAHGRQAINALIQKLCRDPEAGTMLKGTDTWTLRQRATRVDYKLLGTRRDQHIMIVDVAA